MSQKRKELPFSSLEAIEILALVIQKFVDLKVSKFINYYLLFSCCQIL